MTKNCTHEDFFLFHAFHIYINPNTKKELLLFFDVGYCCKKCYKVFKYNKDYMIYNTYGYGRVKTYGESIQKYGKLPCYLVDINKQIINFDEIFTGESAIRKKYNIKKSKAYKGHSKMTPDEEANQILETEEVIFSNK